MNSEIKKLFEDIEHSTKLLEDQGFIEFPKEIRQLISLAKLQNEALEKVSNCLLAHNPRAIAAKALTLKLSDL